MSKHFSDYIETLGQVESIEELHGVCSSFCEGYGFSHFLYGARIPTSFVKPKICIVNSFPDAWWGHYKEQGYMGVDPVLAECSKSSLPLNWKSLHALEKKNAQAARFMNEARTFGLESGISFPLHSAQGEFALLTLSSAENSQQSEKRIAESLPFAHTFAAYVHEAARRLVDVEVHPLPSIRLSAREKECLLWAAEGKTAWEISQILKIAERTVIFHLQNAAAKLGVSSRQQTIAKAVAFGLISPKID